MAVANYENKTFLKECDYETKQYWTRYEIQIFFGIIWFMTCDIKAKHVMGHFNGRDDQFWSYQHVYLSCLIEMCKIPCISWSINWTITIGLYCADYGK